MNQNKQLFGIVDGYSSGSLFAKEIKKMGHDCIHIQSTPQILPIYAESFIEEDYIQNIIHNGDIDTTVQQLNTYDPSYLITGTESGVELADLLCHKMDLFSNGIEYTETKRNKYLMHELLKKHNLNAAEQLKTSDLNEIIDWCRNTDKWPYIIKPLNSAGGDGVRLCHSVADLESSYFRLIQTKNQLGKVNEEILIQNYLKGTEYFVNTVSCAGKHYVANIWKVIRRVTNNCIVEDSMELIRFEGEEVPALSEYALNVLDACEFQYGPTHIEIVVTEKGPTLLELNARLPGGKLPLLDERCMKHDELKLTILAYSDPDKFHEISNEPYQVVKDGRIICFISNVEGTLTSFNYFEDFHRLESFFRIYLNIGPGDKIEKTIDLFSSPGGIEIAHEDLEVLMKDFNTIRECEKKGLYNIESTIS